MDVAFEGQNAFVAAANGDFPLVVLLWGMALPKHVDLLVAEDQEGNTVLHHTASTAIDGNVAIVHFLLQQVTAAGRPLTSLVEARNHAGETPLIRAAHAGNMAVVEALLQFGKAEINAKDKEGNTPAHHAAAQGHLWLLHYLLQAESRLNPSRAPTELGDVCKSKNTVLHYACAREHKVVVQYLLSQGFDPQQANIDGVSALDIARHRKIEWLVKVLESNDRTFAEAPTKCRESRLWVTLLYGSILSGVFSLSYFLPWWIAAPLILLVLWLAFKKVRKPHGHGGHSHGTKNVATLHPSKRDMAVTGSVVLAKPQKEAAFSKRHELSGLSKLFKPQPEMIMGVWAAWVILFIFFHVVVWVDPVYKFVVTDWEPFLYTLVGIEAVFLLTWFRLATVCPSDPGVIRTFQVDITQMLANAATGVVPPEASYCRTCMIRKPIRSKHCAQCGVCVARMDHHCGWINRCVGYGNHRLFVCFLLLHIIVVMGFVLLAAVVFQHFLQPGNLDATLGSSVMRVWMQVPDLVSDHLLALMVFLWGIGTVTGLGFMAVQHLGNMARNLTVNESINWRRYPYLKADPKNDSKAADKSPKLLNPFDKGGWHNTLEFWTRSGSSALDYRTVFRLPNTLDEPEEPIINVQVV